MAGILQRKFIIFFVVILGAAVVFGVCGGRQNAENSADGWYAPGTYKVGVDIPAGEYYAQSVGGIEGFFKINSTKSFKDCQIKCWNNFNNSVYFTVDEGDSLTVNYADFIKAEDAPQAKVGEDQYAENSYKIGKDLPAGDYELLPVEDGAKYSVEKNSLHTSDSVIDESEITKRVNIKLIDGQYISFNNAVLIRE